MPEINPASLQILKDIATKNKANPIDSNSENLEILDSVDGNSNGTIDKKQIDEFIATASAADLKDELAKEGLRLLKLAQSNFDRIKPPAQNPFTFDVDGKKVDFKDDKLIKEPYHLGNSKEEAAWRNELNKFKGQTVVIDENKGLATVKQAFGKDAIDSNNLDADMTKLVEGIWNNKDGITVDGKFEDRRIIRMEEVLGTMKLIESLPADKQQAAKDKFFEKMGKFITDNFGKDGQFTFDTFLGLFQSTDWGKGGHTDKLKGFFKEMLTGMAKNMGIFDEKRKKVLEGNPQLVGNYDGSADGNPFGSLAAVLFKNNKGELELGFLEHATAPEGNKVSALDTSKAKADLQKAIAEAEKLSEAAEKTDKKFTAEQKKAISDLKGADLPAILGGGKDGLTTLLKNLEVIKGLPGLSGDIKTIIDSLISQVNKLIAQADKVPASSTPASSTPASSTPASSTPASSTPASSTPASSTPASSTPASSTPASSTPPDINKIKQDTISLLNGLKASSVSDKAASTAAAIGKLTDKSESKDINEVLTALDGIKKDLEKANKEDPNIKKLEDAINSLKICYKKTLESTKILPPPVATASKVDLEDLKTKLSAVVEKLKKEKTIDEKSNLVDMVNKLGNLSIEELSKLIGLLDGFSKADMAVSVELRAELKPILEKLEAYKKEKESSTPSGGAAP